MLWVRNAASIETTLLLGLNAPDVKHNLGRRPCPRPVFKPILDRIVLKPP